jgi:ornithine decarboxylase
MMPPVELPAGDIQQLVERHGSPLLILDCATAAAQYRRICAALPGVRMHYAMKALPHAAVVDALNRSGSGFDLASRGELRLLEQAGVKPQRVIHTHPIKTGAEIRAALRFGCTTFVVDNPTEIDKFIPYRHRVRLLLRLAVADSGARVNLSRKFGCDPSHAPALLEHAAQARVPVKGLSFHVGSQVTDPGAFVRAIRHCRELIDRNHASADAHLTVLDIGGGFPVDHAGTLPDIEDFCEPLRAELARLPPYVRVIAEPGRFIAAPAVTCVARVIGKAERGGHTWYYLDDGVYGSFSGQVFDGAKYPVSALKVGTLQPCVVAGPTCDSIDVISELAQLPDLDIGDVVVAPMMGAYTAASATDFNNLERAKFVVINADAIEAIADVA